MVLDSIIEMLRDLKRSGLAMLLVLSCPRCGGRPRLIATAEDPRDIREVLAGLARSAEPMDRAPSSWKSFGASISSNVAEKPMSLTARRPNP